MEQVIKKTICVSLFCYSYLAFQKHFTSTTNIIHSHSQNQVPVLPNVYFGFQLPPRNSVYVFLSPTGILFQLLYCLQTFKDDRETWTKLILFESIIFAWLSRQGLQKYSSGNALLQEISFKILPILLETITISSRTTCKN